MSEHHFWLSDDPFNRLKPLLPNKVRGVPRVDDRKVISGIIHVIRYGPRWRDDISDFGLKAGDVWNDCPHVSQWRGFLMKVKE